MRVLHKTFENQLATRQRVLQKAAEFATQLGPERLINITHSEVDRDFIVTIWYWDGEPVKKQMPPATTDTERVSLRETPSDTGDKQDDKRIATSPHANRRRELAGGLRAYRSPKSQ
jgi:hypothetical protein